MEASYLDNRSPAYSCDLRASSEPPRANALSNSPKSFLRRSLRVYLTAAIAPGFGNISIA